MVTCTFMGHEEEYDLNLKENLARAVQRVVRLDSKIEFVFQRNTHFNFLCLAAALEARQRNPKKEIVLTLIACGGSAPIMESGLLPLCAFDKVVRLPPAAEGAGRGKQYPEWKKAEREMLRKSDCLICYVYPDLRDSFNDLYEFAMRQPELAVFNAADPDTADAIRREGVARLEADRQYIVRALWKGESYSPSGKRLGSPARPSITGTANPGV